MKGTLSLLVENIDNKFSDNYEYHGDEYLKALQNYQGVDFNNMMGVECCVSEMPSKNTQNNEYYEVSCLCCLLDEGGVIDLTVDNIFDMVYSQQSMKRFSVVIDYDTMDMEFEDDFSIWVGDSERLLKQAVDVFGNGLLPCQNFYFEFLNNKGESVKILFENSIMLNKYMNKITIGCDKIKLIEVK